MIGMQVTEKYLGQVFGRNHQRVDVAHRAGADIENHLLAITELEQETGRRLAAARVRHAGAAGDNANLVLGQYLGAGIIDVAVGRDYIGPLDHAAGGLRRRHAKASNQWRA